jgi:hypothetical protein
MRRFNFAIGVMLLWSAVCGGAQAPTSSTATPASTQAAISSPAMDSLAEQIAQQIEKKHLKSVLVIGAVGSDAARLTQDGQEIGDEFSAALMKHANGFQVVDRGTLRNFLKKNGISEAMAVSDAMANWIPRMATVAGYIVIRIGEVSNGRAKIVANLYRTDVGDMTLLGKSQTELELSDEQKRVGFRPLDSDWNKPTISDGESKKLPPERSPKCTSCPSPQFSDSFRHTVGLSADVSVSLYVTVFPDGKVGEIAIVKPGPHGLNETVAQNILQNWHFKPAVDSDGNPIAFRTSVEVRYQTY